MESYTLLEEQANNEHVIDDEYDSDFNDAMEQLRVLHTQLKDTAQVSIFLLKKNK